MKGASLGLQASLALLCAVLLFSLGAAGQELENVALGKATTASSVHLGTWLPERAVDGNWTQGFSRWITAAQQDPPHWLEIDLDGSFVLYSAEVWTGLVTDPVSQFKLQYWQGDDWVDIPGAAVYNNTEALVRFDFTEPVVADRVRLYSDASGENQQIRVRELLVYGVPEHAGKPTVAERSARPELGTMPKTVSVKTIDISGETDRHVIVAQGSKLVYHAHPTTVLLPDNKTMYAVWTYDHGGAVGPMKRSMDGGLTWSDLLPVPRNWSSVYNCPAIYFMVDADGVERLIVYTGGDRSGDGLMHMAYSEDYGETWTAMQKTNIKMVMPWTTIIELGNGKYMAQTNARREGDPDEKSNLIIQSWSEDGGLTWTDPVIVLDLPEYKPAEPALIQSPDGKRLVSIMREQTRQLNSLIMVSDDHGQTWSEPWEVPAGLTGDRHQAKYSHDGRLVITFRDMAPHSPTYNHFVAWVGTFDDLIQGNEGEYRIKLLHSYAGWDTGYPGLELLPDGTFVATTYVKYRPGTEQHSIVSARFSLDEMDEKLGARSSELANVALFKPVKESSVREGWVGSRVVDGDLSASSRWISQHGAPPPHWLEIDLQGMHVLEKAEVWTGIVVEPVASFSIQYWTGDQWTQIAGASVEGNDQQLVTFNFDPPVVTDRVRFYSEEYGLGEYLRVREVLVYGRPVS